MGDLTITPVALRGITQQFGRRLVLRDVELEVKPGEVVGLLGANGSGKTTLLNIVAGLQQPSGGARTFGADARAAVGIELRARMALVAHTPQVYPRLTARENLELFGDLRAAAVGDRGLDAAQVLERIGLSAAADQLVGTFSRGMLQRLALGRALAGRPQLLLLDEPFTALDRDGRELLVDVLAEQRDRGVAVLLCSHDLDVVVRVADRVALLEGGCIVGEERRPAPPERDDEGFRARVAALATGGARARA